MEKMEVMVYAENTEENVTVSDYLTIVNQNRVMSIYLLSMLNNTYQVVTDNHLQFVNVCLFVVDENSWQQKLIQQLNPVFRIHDVF